MEGKKFLSYPAAQGIRRTLLQSISPDDMNIPYIMLEHNFLQYEDMEAKDWIVQGVHRYPQEIHRYPRGIHHHPFHLQINASFIEHLCKSCSQVANVTTSWIPFAAR